MKQISAAEAVEMLSEMDYCRRIGQKDRKRIAELIDNLLAGLLVWQNASIELNRQIDSLKREVAELRRGEGAAE